MPLPPIYMNKKFGLELFWQRSAFFRRCLFCGRTHLCFPPASYFAANNLEKMVDFCLGALILPQRLLPADFVFRERAAPQVDFDRALWR